MVWFWVDLKSAVQFETILCDSSSNAIAVAAAKAKNRQNLDQKVNQQQNTVCLEQQIYASSENFTPTQLGMLESFRRSFARYKINKFKKSLFSEGRLYQ